jgi:hypothetical protein
MISISCTTSDKNGASEARSSKLYHNGIELINRTATVCAPLTKV